MLLMHRLSLFISEDLTTPYDDHFEQLLIDLQRRTQPGKLATIKDSIIMAQMLPFRFSVF